MARCVSSPQRFFTIEGLPEKRYFLTKVIDEFSAMHNLFLMFADMDQQITFVGLMTLLLLVSCSDEIAETPESPIDVPREVLYVGYEVPSEGLNQSVLYGVSSENNSERILSLGEDLTPWAMTTFRSGNTVLMSDWHGNAVTYDLSSREIFEGQEFPARFDLSSDDAFRVTSITENSAASWYLDASGHYNVFFHRLPTYEEVQQVPSLGEDIGLAGMAGNYYAISLVDNNAGKSVELYRWSEISSSPDKQVTLNLETDLASDFAGWHLFDDVIFVFTDSDSLLRFDANLELLEKQYADFDAYKAILPMPSFHLPRTKPSQRGYGDTQYDGRYLYVKPRIVGDNLEVPEAIDLQTLERSSVIDSEAISEMFLSNDLFANLVMTTYKVDFDNGLLIFGFSDTTEYLIDPDSNDQIFYFDFSGNLLESVPAVEAPIEIILP